MDDNHLPIYLLTKQCLQKANKTFTIWTSLDPKLDIERHVNLRSPTKPRQD